MKPIPNTSEESDFETSLNPPEKPEIFQRNSYQLDEVFLQSQDDALATYARWVGAIAAAKKERGTIASLSIQGLSNEEIIRRYGPKSQLASTDKSC